MSVSVFATADEGRIQAHGDRFRRCGRLIRRCIAELLANL
jgi:hypothetical protein